MIKAGEFPGALLVLRPPNLAHGGAPDSVKSRERGAKPDKKKTKGNVDANLKMECAIDVAFMSLSRVIYVGFICEEAIVGLMEGKVPQKGGFCCDWFFCGGNLGGVEGLIKEVTRCLEEQLLS